MFGRASTPETPKKKPRDAKRRDAPDSEASESEESDMESSPRRKKSPLKLRSSPSKKTESKSESSETKETLPTTTKPFKQEKHEEDIDKTDDIQECPAWKKHTLDLTQEQYSNREITVRKEQWQHQVKTPHHGTLTLFKRLQEQKATKRLGTSTEPDIYEDQLDETRILKLDKEGRVTQEQTLTVKREVYSTHTIFFRKETFKQTHTASDGEKTILREKTHSETNTEKRAFNPFGS